MDASQGLGGAAEQKRALSHGLCGYTEPERKTPTALSHWRARPRGNRGHAEIEDASRAPEALRIER